MARALKVSLFAIALLALLFTHLIRLSAVPGLHFDEAWALNYAWQIRSEPGFWPLAAMSPYTAPWAHYEAAVFFLLFGPSLLVFRLSQAVMALCGLVLLGFSLPKKNLPSVRWYFPFSVLLLPGLVLNHRFAIELTGLHVFCFGLLCFCLSRKHWRTAAAAALIGSTGHILFYAVPLGLLLAVSLNETAALREARARQAFSVYFAVMALFFLCVLVAIPEKGKAGTLVFSAIAAGMFLWKKWDQKALWKTNKWWGRVLALCSLVFLSNAIFFGQGAWVFGTFSGYSPPSQSLGLFLLGCGMAALVLMLFGGLFLSRFFLGRELALPPLLRTWLLAGTFFSGLMMLKPTPRYFELTLVGLAVVLAFFLAQSRELKWLGPPRKGFPALWPFLGIANLSIYLLVAAPIRPIDRNLVFFLFKDSSRDFLDKQTLVRFLGGSGCAPSDIQTHDPRLKETLQALSLGDWLVDGNSGQTCPFEYVARKTEEGASGESFGEFLVRRISGN